MVEQVGHRQPAVDAVADHGVHHHRIGLDPQLVQQRQQERGLGLAVAEAARPGGLGVGGDQSALPHDQRHVAHALLHQVERGLGPGLGIGRQRADLLQLGAQRPLGGDHRGLGEQRRHQGAHVGPRLEVRGLDQPADGIARRRALGRDHRLHVVQRQVERIAAGARDRRQGRQAVGLAQPQRQAVRPLHVQVRALHRGAVPGAGDLLDVALQHRVAGADRHHELQDVADLQPLGLDVGGQHPVQGGALQVRLAAHHREGLARAQHVDGLVAPADHQPVYGGLVGVGAPGERDVAGVQPLGGLDLQRDVGIDRGVAGLERQLLVRQHDPHRALGRLGRLGRQGDRLHPGGRRSECRLVRRGRPGARRRRRCQDYDHQPGHDAPKAKLAA